MFRALALVLALGLALTLAGRPSAADGFAAGPAVDRQPAPRWSNEHHNWAAIDIGPDCLIYPAPGFGAAYMPGVDAWGRPIVPLESPRAYGGALPLGGEIDFQLLRMQIGEFEYEMGGYIPLEPGRGPIPSGGPSLPRDCHPGFLPDVK